VKHSDENESIRALAKDTGLEIETCRLLEKKGLTTRDEIFDYLHPNVDMLKHPFNLKGMKEARDKILEYISKDKKIVIYGDYDCDGIGASAILFLTLRHIGSKCDVFLPVRSDDGYGLTSESVVKVIEKHKPDLIITVDCGINSCLEIETLLNAGVDVIVTDHHEISTNLPACITINPKLNPGYDPLCGAGVAFKLSQALTSLDFVLQYIDIVAISTIADIVPLIGENRILARLGLEVINSSPQPGIRALLECSGIRKCDGDVSATDVAFKIAPRLNASGRLSNAEKSFRLFCETDDSLIAKLASELDQENRKRQELCKKIEGEILVKLRGYDLFSNSTIVLYDREWESGVVGIVASKIARKFKRPVIILTDDSKNGIIKGSGRSISGINIHNALIKCKDLLVRFGGHSVAVGLSLKLENLQRFSTAFSDAVTHDTENKTLDDEIAFDLQMPIKGVTLKFAHELTLFEPFGCENPRLRFLDICGPLTFDYVGKQKLHLKSKISDTAEIIAFNMGEYKDDLYSTTKKRIYYEIDINKFMNKTYAQCKLDYIELDYNSAVNDKLLENFARCANLPSRSGIKEKILFLPNHALGHLVIAFSKITFEKLAHQYPSYSKRYASLEGVNPKNTILLSPFNESGFEYYALIEVHDAPSEQYIEALDSKFRATIRGIFESVRFNVENALTDDELRDLYRILYMLDGKSTSLDELYNTCKNRKASLKREKFMTAYYILNQLELANFDTNGVFRIGRKQCKLADSSIYGAIIK
jgi:single-stranded-DNA-specific exonuclease